MILKTLFTLIFSILAIKCRDKKNNKSSLKKNNYNKYKNHLAYQASSEEEYERKNTPVTEQIFEQKKLTLEAGNVEESTKPIIKKYNPPIPKTVILKPQTHTNKNQFINEKKRMLDLNHTKNYKKTQLRQTLNQPINNHNILYQQNNAPQIQPIRQNKTHENVKLKKNYETLNKENIDSQNNSLEQEVVTKKINNKNDVVPKIDTVNAYSKEKVNSNKSIVNMMAKYQKNELPNLGPVQNTMFDLLIFFFSEKEILKIDPLIADNIYKNINSVIKNINVLTPQNAIDPVSLVNNILLPFEAIHGNLDIERMHNIKRDITRMSIAFKPNSLKNGYGTPRNDAMDVFITRSNNIKENLQLIKDEINEVPEYSDGKRQNFMNFFSQRVTEMYFTAALAENFKKNPQKIKKIKMDIYEVNIIMNNYLKKDSSLKITKEISPMTKFALKLNEFINQDPDMIPIKHEIRRKKNIATINKIKKCLTPKPFKNRAKKKNKPIIVALKSNTTSNVN